MESAPLGSTVRNMLMNGVPMQSISTWNYQTLLALWNTLVSGEKTIITWSLSLLIISLCTGGIFLTKRVFTPKDTLCVFIYMVISVFLLESVQKMVKLDASLDKSYVDANISIPFPLVNIIQQPSIKDSSWCEKSFSRQLENKRDDLVMGSQAASAYRRLIRNNVLRTKEKDQGTILLDKNTGIVLAETSPTGKTKYTRAPLYMQPKSTEYCIFRGNQASCTSPKCIFLQDDDFEEAHAEMKYIKETYEEFQNLQFTLKKERNQYNKLSVSLMSNYQELYKRASFVQGEFQGAGVSITSMEQDINRIINDYDNLFKDGLNSLETTITLSNTTICVTILHDSSSNAFKYSAVKKNPPIVTQESVIKIQNNTPSTNTLSNTTGNIMVTRNPIVGNGILTRNGIVNGMVPRNNVIRNNSIDGVVTRNNTVDGVMENGVVTRNGVVDGVVTRNGIVVENDVVDTRPVCIEKNRPNADILCKKLLPSATAKYLSSLIPKSLLQVSHMTSSIDDVPTNTLNTYNTPANTLNTYNNVNGNTYDNTYGNVNSNGVYDNVNGNTYGNGVYSNGNVNGMYNNGNVNGVYSNVNGYGNGNGVYDNVNGYGNGYGTVRSEYTNTPSTGLSNAVFDNNNTYGGNGAYGGNTYNGNSYGNGNSAYGGSDGVYGNGTENPFLISIYRMLWVCEILMFIQIFLVLGTIIALALGRKQLYMVLYLTITFTFLLSFLLSAFAFSYASSLSDMCRWGLNCSSQIDRGSVMKSNGELTDIPQRALEQSVSYSEQVLQREIDALLRTSSMEDIKGLLDKIKRLQEVKKDFNDMTSGNIHKDLINKEEIYLYIRAIKKNLMEFKELDKRIRNNNWSDVFKDVSQIKILLQDSKTNDANRRKREKLVSLSGSNPKSDNTTCAGKESTICQLSSRMDALFIGLFLFSLLLPFLILI
ncbi:hypothetical protein NEFER01_0193 [Nematocida sp. LUAm1]|nr:hypothetical protein NEFER02_0163 [Nematocida sp. LUAm2]KAI5176868.1 hypothetical protein NEFER01_0193 [Nematocida sp. LUAm1]